MKFSLLVIGFLAIVSLSFSEAVEESSSLKQNSQNKINIHMYREIRSAEKKAKKVRRKSGRKNKNKSVRKNENGKKSGKKNEKISKRRNKIKTRRKNKRKSEKKRNKAPRKGGNQIAEKKGRKSINPFPGGKTRLSGRANLVGSHCEFVDLCVIDRMSESGCNMGDKFVIKSPKGTRRQFLMVDGSKIIAFLQNGKKITDCGGNLTDVTNKVTCKAVAGAGTLKLSRQNSTNETTTVAAAASEEAPTTGEAPNTDEAAPTDEAPTTDEAPNTDEAAPTDEAPTTDEAPITDEMPPLQAGQFHCPCPQRTCFTTITSTNNKHKIECGSKTFNVPCGGPLKGSKLGLLISIIDVFEQPLCSTNTYVTLIKDLVWKCSDLTIPEDGPCEVDATTAAPGDATTDAPETTGPDSSESAMGAITTGDTNVTAPEITTASNDTVTTIASTDTVTTTASNDTVTTTASNDTVTTTASNDTVTTTASNDTATTTTSNDTVTTTASNDTVTTTVSGTTTTASVTTTTG